MVKTRIKYTALYHLPSESGLTRCLACFRNSKTRLLILMVTYMGLCAAATAQNCMVIDKPVVDLSTRSLQYSTCTTPMIIPVVIHFAGNIAPYSAGDSLCIVESIDRQMEQLNSDFGGYNTDISEYCALVDQGCGFDPDVLATTSCIQFVIATTNHPSVTISNDPSSRLLADGEYAVTFGKHPITQFNCTGPGTGCSSPLFDTNNTDWHGYMNIYVSDVIPANAPLLDGEPSVFGAANQGSASIANGSGVWINASRFGGDGVACITSGVTLNQSGSMGRTLTHEAGHHFGLPHIFHDDGGSCSQDADGIADTPIQVTPNASNVDYLGTNCGEHPSRQSACPGSFYFNFMDYVRDDQMFMFTKGQVAVMNSTLAANASGTYPFIDYQQVASSTPGNQPLLANGCVPVNTDFPDAPCINIIYADYEYQCGDNFLSVTVGEEVRFNGRNCGSTSPPTTGSGSSGTSRPGSGPGRPGSSGTTRGGGTVNPGVDVPVVNENEECQECIKELQRKIELLKNSQNGGN